MENQIKKKLEHIWDWYIVWYLYDKPKDIYRTIRHWWKCNGKNPYHWKLLFYAMFHHYGWDNGFNYELLRLSILKSKYYFENSMPYISDIHMDDIIKWQNIAINLLDIIVENKKLWSFDNNHYKCLVYVNKKNMDRFAVRGYNPDCPYNKTEWISNFYILNPHELYMEKAKRLLYRIMTDYADGWWD